MTSLNNENYKMGLDEEFKKISNDHKLELGSSLNENHLYREVGYLLGLDREVIDAQLSTNPGYEILSKWSKKGPNRTIRILTQTFKKINREDLCEKVEELRYDNMSLNYVINETENGSSKPIAGEVTVPSRKPLIDAIKATVMTHYKSHLIGKNFIAVSVDGCAWNDSCKSVKGSQVKVTVKKHFVDDQKNEVSPSPQNDHGCVFACSKDDSPDTSLQTYNNAFPDKLHIENLPGYFDLDREQTEKKLQEVTERKYILRYRALLKSENDSHLVLSFRYNSDIWHFLIFKGSADNSHFYLFSDGYFASTVSELLAYYQDIPISSETVDCPNCCLDGPAK